MPRDIFGAPAPQDAGGAFYSTVKAQADAGALQAQATSHAVDTVLSALQGAMAMKQRREEKLMDALLERDLEQQRQSGRMALAEYEQTAYNDRNDARLEQRRQEAQAKMRLDYQKTARQLRQSQQRLALDRRQENRLQRTQDAEAGLADLRRQNLEVGLSLNLENLNAAREREQERKLQEKQKKLAGQAVMGLLDQGPDGRIRLGSEPGVLEMLRGLAPQNPDAGDPTVALGAMQELLKMRGEMGKQREAATKPEADAQKRDEDIRLKIWSTGFVTTPEQMEDALKLIKAKDTPGREGGQAAPAAQPQPQQPRRPGGAQQRVMGALAPWEAQQPGPKDPRSLIDRYRAGALSQEEVDALSDEEFKALLEQAKAAKATAGGG